jgi:type I restriction enzyme M protein
MKPHLAEAEHARLDGIVIKEKLRALRASRDGSDSVIALEEQLRGCERVIREKEAKARAVDAAVFDLKAVNPNAVIKLDPRSPEELIASIREQGNVMGAALIRLEELVQGLAAHSQPIASCSAQPGKRA